MKHRMTAGTFVFNFPKIGMSTWSWLYKDWEIDEHKDRLNRYEVQKIMLGLVRCGDMAPAPPGSDIESFDNPLRFPRSWTGWLGNTRYRYRGQQ